MFNIYHTSRDWDCYNDRPGDTLTHWLGVSWRRFFFGLTWDTDSTFVEKNTWRGPYEVLQAGTWTPANEEQSEGRFNRG